MDPISPNTTSFQPSVNVNANDKRYDNLLFILKIIGIGILLTVGIAGFLVGMVYLAAIVGPALVASKLLFHIAFIVGGLILIIAMMVIPDERYTANGLKL